MARNLVSKHNHTNDPFSKKSHSEKSYSKTDSADFFFCANCGQKVFYKAPGTKNRNHCPFCLFSLHVDNEPGDRGSICGGLMKPIGKIYKPDGEEVLVHQCEKCGNIRKNRIAGDDSFELVEKLYVMDFF